RHAPIHRRSGHSDIAICCGRNVRGSSPSTSVVPLSNQVTTLNHKRFKGFKMFSDGHLDVWGQYLRRNGRRCRTYRRRCALAPLEFDGFHPPRGMVSAPSSELKTCTPATRSALASGHFSAQTARRDSSARCRGNAYGQQGCWKIRGWCHPIVDGLPTRKPSETNSSPLAQGNPRQLVSRAASSTAVFFLPRRQARAPGLVCAHL